MARRCCWYHNSESNDGSPRDWFTIVWSTGAITIVVFPLLLCGMAALISNKINDKNNNNGGQWWGNNNDDTSDDKQSGNNNNASTSSPWWWLWGGGDVEERSRDEHNNGHWAVVFTYVWSLLMFTAIVWYGHLIFRKQAHPLPLLSAMLVFGNACFMSLILTSQLGVNYDDRQLEERGWLSQFGACATLTYAGYMLYCVFFFVWIRVRTHHQPSDVVPVYTANDALKMHGYGIDSSPSTISQDYQRQDDPQEEREIREPGRFT